MACSAYEIDGVMRAYGRLREAMNAVMTGRYDIARSDLLGFVSSVNHYRDMFDDANDIINAVTAGLGEESSAKEHGLLYQIETFCTANRLSQTGQDNKPLCGVSVANLRRLEKKFFSSLDKALVDKCNLPLGASKGPSSGGQKPAPKQETTQPKKNLAKRQ